MSTDCFDGNLAGMGKDYFPVSVITSTLLLDSDITYAQTVHLEAETIIAHEYFEHRCIVRI